MRYVFIPYLFNMEMKFSKWNRRNFIYRLSFRGIEENQGDGSKSSFAII